MFGQFQRGEGAGDRGTGLGLAMRWAIGLHGGRIAVVPRPAAAAGSAPNFPRGLPPRLTGPSVCSPHHHPHPRRPSHL